MAETQALLELNPYSLHALRAAGAAVEAAGECALENKAQLESLLDAVLPDRKVAGAKAACTVWPSSMSWYVSSDTEAMLDRTDDAIRAILAGRLKDPSAPFAYACCSAADGRPVSADGTEKWIAAFTSVADLEEASNRLLELKVDPTDVTAGAFAGIGAVSAALRGAGGGGTVIVWDLGARDSHLILINSKGAEACARCEVGMDAVIDAVQAALKLKFKGAGARLFFNEAYDFTDPGPRVAATLSHAVKEALALLPTLVVPPPLACLTLTGRQSWFVREVATVVGLAPWEPDLPKVASDLGVTLPEGDPALSLSSIGLLGLLGSKKEADGPWSPAWTEAEGMAAETEPAPSEAPPPREPEPAAAPEKEPEPEPEPKPAPRPAVPQRAKPTISLESSSGQPPGPKPGKPAVTLRPAAPQGSRPPIAPAAAAVPPARPPPAARPPIPAPAGTAFPLPGGSSPPIPAAEAPLPVPPPGPSFPPPQAAPPSFSDPGFPMPEAPGAPQEAGTPAAPPKPGAGIKMGGIPGAGAKGVPALPFDKSKLKAALAAAEQAPPPPPPPKSKMGFYIGAAVAAAIIAAGIAVTLEARRQKAEAEDRAQQEQIARQKEEEQHKIEMKQLEVKEEQERKEAARLADLARKEAEERARREAAAQMEADRLSKLPGTLVFSTVPDSAAISVDGGEARRSPVRMEGLSPGSHHVVVTLAGFDTIELSPEILGSKTTDLGTLTMQRAYGTLSLTSTPDNLEFAVRPAGDPKGRPLRTGRTPASFDDINHGDYEVTYTRPGCRDHVEKVHVNKGETAVADTKYLNGSLDLSSEPSGANVSKDGEFLGTTPLSLHDLTPKKATFDLTLAGYDSTHISVDIPEGQVLTYTAEILRKDRVFKVGEAPTQPRAVDSPAPKLSPAQRKAGAEVVISLIVHRDGTVSNVEVESATDDDIGRRCKDAVENWTFMPARADDDRTVDSRLELPFKFAPQ
jgi:TonB family protein